MENNQETLQPREDVVVLSKTAVATAGFLLTGLIGLIVTLFAVVWNQHKKEIEAKIAPIAEKVAEVSNQNKIIISSQYSLREYLIKIAAKVGVPDIPPFFNGSFATINYREPLMPPEIPEIKSSPAAIKEEKKKYTLWKIKYQSSE